MNYYKFGKYHCNKSHPVCSIVPPHILHAMISRGDDEQRNWAIHALLGSQRSHTRRNIVSLMTDVSAPSRQLRRTIYDAKNGAVLPSPQPDAAVRIEGGSPTGDIAADEAYDYSGKTYEFYKTVYNRNSLNDKGLELVSSVHYRRKYDNASWDGSQMEYGDGDGKIFQRFTKCVDVVGHELTHGVTSFTANLDYQDQSGALNESFSDVFGSLVKQYSLKQTADKADWLIGKDLLAPNVNGEALRSMKEPGTAYDDPALGGKDPQPGHMKDWYDDRDNLDNGGVHLNSGIPNHAFYLVATEIGGPAWEKAGLIWYIALRDRLTSTSQFKDTAKATFDTAGAIYGDQSKEQKAVQKGWEAVGVRDWNNIGIEKGIKK
jgi:Zn-dependent metalloprotease